MEMFGEIVSKLDSIIWGPVTLVFFVGTGVFLTFKLGFRTWLNLPHALKMVLSKEAHQKEGDGDVSAFGSLMTALAATIGTGNIVGVATAMVSGGPGALVWMWIAALFGFSTKYGECLLSTKYREVNDKGEISGGPMYAMKNGFKNKKVGNIMGFLFALFTAIATFGIGNMSQANSVAGSFHNMFGVSTWIIGIVMTLIIFPIVVGGIKSISGVSTIVVPAMALLYVAAGLVAIILNYRNIPSGLEQIFVMAFNPHAIGGGVIGTITVSVMNSMRFGIARGVFSNEAGLGSAAIPAAASTISNPARQGYISMTGTFFDTIIVCTITGLTIASSGVLGTVGADGKPLEGVALTAAAFSTVLGPVGKYLVSIGIILFAFSTILGWEYYGEKAFEYLVGSTKYSMLYRAFYALMTLFGATQSLDLVWGISDIMNALMAFPNLIALIVLSGVIKEETDKYQEILKK